MLFGREHVEKYRQTGDVGLIVLLVMVVLGTAAPAAATTDPPGSCQQVAADPFGSTPCPDVRPGAVLMMPTPGPHLDVVRCTAAFLFRARGEVYLATAGHCADDGQLAADGEVVWPAGAGPEVRDSDGERIGEVAYALWTIRDTPLSSHPQALPPDADLALVRLDRGVAFSPQMCHFGGPTGVNHDQPAVPTPVTLHHFGATIAGGYDHVGMDRWLLPARTAVATGMPDEHTVLAYGHASFYDSGSPVISSDGRAVGILSGPPDDLPHDGHGGAFVLTRLRPQLRRAEQALGFELRLLTAELT